MNVVNVKLLLVALMSLMVGTVGCATGQSFNTTSLDSSGVLFDVGQNALQSTTAGEVTGGQIVSNSATPAGQVVHASFPETVEPSSTAPAAAPLTTLGPNDDLLNIVQQASGVVLLDFYADWCGPCRTQGGILHEMEQTASQNHASIIKVNVDQHRRLASAFNVTSMPTLIVIKDGLIIERQTGVANHQRVASLLSR